MSERVSVSACSPAKKDCRDKQIQFNLNTMPQISIINGVGRGVCGGGSVYLTLSLHI